MSNVSLTKRGDAKTAVRRGPLRSWLLNLRNISAITVFEWSVAAVVFVCFAVGFTVGMAAMLSGDVGTAPQQSCANWFGSTAADSICIP